MLNRLKEKTPFKNYLRQNRLYFVILKQQVSRREKLDLGLTGLGSSLIGVEEGSNPARGKKLKKY
eukprot:403375558